MSQIDGGVEPVFDCKYPCKSCSPFNKSDCETCFTGLAKPKYLQPDRVTGEKTCKQQCDLGYTFDIKSIDYQCFPCDKTCATCRTGG